MPTTNYISAVVKILERPVQIIAEKNIPAVKCRVQSPQFRNKVAISLVFWGKLGQDIRKYYQINDYILVEGYLSLPTEKKVKARRRNFKKVEITPLKVYPFFLKDSREKEKHKDEIK